MSHGAGGGCSAKTPKEEVFRGIFTSASTEGGGRKMKDFKIMTQADFSSRVDEGNGAGIRSHQMEANWTISRTDWPQLGKIERRQGRKMVQVGEQQL